jgi:hypothetical protein
MGLGGHPTSTDGFILGPSHGTVGRLLNLVSYDPFVRLLNLICNKIFQKCI